MYWLGRSRKMTRHMPAPFVLAVLALAVSIPSTAQPEKVLYAFDSQGTPDGGLPTAPLVEDVHGNLYGTAAVGGTGCSFDCGVVFQVSPPAHRSASWTATIIHNFGATPNDGIIPGPNAGLVIDKEGNLYGTTTAGGANCTTPPVQGCGTVFELSPPTTPGGEWIETVLLQFSRHREYRARWL